LGDFTAGTYYQRGRRPRCKLLKLVQCANAQRVQSVELSLAQGSQRRLPVRSQEIE
jgi:hypothetical protein